MMTPTSIPGFLIGEQLPERREEQPRPIASEPAESEFGVGPGDPGYGDSGFFPVGRPSADGVGRAVPAAKAAGRYPFSADLGVPDGPGGLSVLYAAVAR